MKKVIVIGGGFAGLSAAVHLTKAGHKVTLLEASKKLGGRAYSLIDKETNTIIDNGQHIIMGCYKDTLEFFEIIGATKNLIFQKKLKVNFLKEVFNLFPLEAGNMPYPFNLLQGLLKYKAISFKDRLKLLSFFLKIYTYNDERLKKLTVHQWLLLERQNEKIRNAFWNILCVGALNTSPEKASAKIFSDVLKEIFLKGNNAATIILPKEGLTEAYCNHSKEYIEKNGGEVIFQEPVTGLKIKNEKLKEVVTANKTITEFDFAVAAIPHYALKKLIELPKHEEIDYEYSAILTFHFWLKSNPLENTFYGLIDSPVHWIFNRDTHITLVISDANHLIEKSKEELLKIAVGEIEKFTSIKKEDITSHKIIKEKRSTFIPSNKITDKRPSSKTEIENLFFAGDWTDTGLPATIEGAVRSGKMAAGEVYLF